VSDATAPRARPVVGVVGVVLALALAGLGVVGLQELGVHLDWIGDPGWTSAAADWLDGARAATWTTVAAVAAILVGLAFLFSALKPRRRTHLPAGDLDTGSVWVSPQSLALLAKDAAERVPTVVTASATGTRRRLRVEVATTDAASAQSAVAAAVNERLAGVYPADRVVVSCQEPSQ